MIEAQSEPDLWIAFRLMKYVILFSEKHKKKQSKLPLIIPIVFYHGNKKYDSPRNLRDLFEDSEQAKSFIGGDYKLIDLSLTPDFEIKKKKHLGMM